VVAERKFIDKVIANICVEVIVLKKGSDMVLVRLHNLNLSNVENAPVPNVYMVIVERFTNLQGQWGIKIRSSQTWHSGFEEIGGDH
jgi:hypothetical protein